MRVWDPLLVRSFHWSLTGAVPSAFLTGDALEDLHVFVGDVVMGPIVARLVWGLIGPRARVVKAYHGGGSRRSNSFLTTS